MNELSKKQRKVARELMRIAYAREEDCHLEKLAQHFDAFRNHQIKGWELNELIHQYHNGILRDIYKIYNYTKSEVYLLARAVHLGFLKDEEIPDDFIEAVNVLRKNLDVN